jgi:hypothetical protein
MSLNNGLNVVADHATNGILAYPRSPACANYTSLGMLDTYAATIPVDLPHVKLILSNYTIGKDYLMVSRKKGTYVEPMPDHMVTEEFLERKKLAELRAKYIYFQEAYYRYFLIKSVFAPENLGGVIDNALKNSDPTISKYSDPIKDYSEILNIKDEEAYDELKLLLDSTQAIRMRYFAYYRRNVDALNKLTTQKELEQYSANSWYKIINDAIL